MATQRGGHAPPTIDLPDPISITTNDTATPALEGQNLGSGQAGSQQLPLGVRGNAPSGTGVLGLSVGHAGVQGESQRSDAVVGIAHNASAAGISGQNAAQGGGLAGRFTGDVVVTRSLHLANPIHVDATSTTPIAFVYTIQHNDLYPSPDDYVEDEALGYPFCAIINHQSLFQRDDALVFVTPIASQKPGNFQGGGSQPTFATPVAVMFGALPYNPPVGNPKNNAPAIPPAVQNQWVILNASEGQQFHVLVFYTRP